MARGGASLEDCGLVWQVDLDSLEEEAAPPPKAQKQNRRARAPPPSRRTTTIARAGRVRAHLVALMRA